MNILCPSGRPYCSVDHLKMDAATLTKISAELRKLKKSLDSVLENGCQLKTALLQPNNSFSDDQSVSTSHFYL